MLQTRNGKRTAMAALKFSMDMVKEKTHRLAHRHSAQPGRSARPTPRPGVRPQRGQEGQGHCHRPSAGPGAATGRIYFNADRAVSAAEKGEKVLLVRVETSPEIFAG